MSYEQCPDNSLLMIQLITISIEVPRLQCLLTIVKTSLKNPNSLETGDVADNYSTGLYSGSTSTISLHNYLKILKKCFLGVICSAYLNIQSHSSVLHVAKGLAQLFTSRD